jgi:transcriptional regulator with XRE-family HTH domain
MRTETDGSQVQHVLASIKAEMARRDLTQAQLAEHLGLTQGQMSKRLRGVVPLTVPELLSVADTLGITPSSLLDAA